MRDEWKMPFMRIEYQIAATLFILVPVALAVAVWHTSLWLVPPVLVGGYFGTKEVVWVIEVVLSDFLFEDDEFNRLTWRVENEIWGWTGPYK